MNHWKTVESGLVDLLPRLRRFAFALSRNPSDADDLLQMTVERALRSKDRWQEGTRLDSWAFTVMRNQWIDSVRARSRKDNREAPIELADTVGFDPVPGMEANIDLQRAMEAMAKLPDEQRAVVALILIEGFGYREAAEILELPIGTVSSRLVRGRAALLNLLGEG